MRHWDRSFLIEIGESLCILVIFTCDLIIFELYQKFLHIFLPLLLGLAVPRVHLVSESLLLHFLLCLQLDLLLKGCTLFANSSTLFEVEIEVFLLNAVF